jgi:exopolysaccharide biosynthesis polyprenyl glycosylphosphotransferase
MLLRRPFASAVIVPPTVLYTASLVSVILVSGFLHQWTWGWSLLRPAVIAALHLPLLYALRASWEGPEGPSLPWWAIASASAVLVAFFDFVVPPPFSPSAILWTIAIISMAVQPLGRLWRAYWERFEDVNATLVISSARDARDVIAQLETIPGLQITSVLIPGASARAASALLGRPVFTRTSAILNLEKRAIVSAPTPDPRIRAAVAQLVARGFEIASESAVMRTAEGRVDSTRADPLNLLLGQPSSTTLGLVSRLQDVAVSASVLLLLSPLFFFISVAILIESGWPIFYRQRRLGLRGRPFKVIKFRTMVQNAEAETGPVWAAENDPRITPLGEVLRRLRFDELPQLLNVLAGHMALVGPRPERAHFFRKLRADVPIFELRTAVRPGITGWAQIRAGYAAAAEDSREKLDHDLFYVSRRSPWFDLAILFDTVRVAFARKGSR